MRTSLISRVFIFDYSKKIGSKITTGRGVHKIMEGIKLSSKNDELKQLGIEDRSCAERAPNLSAKILEIYCLYRITAILSGEMDVEATIKVAKHLFQQTFELDHYSFFLVDETGQDLIMRNWFGFRRIAGSKERFALDEDIFGAALQNGSSIYIRDLDSAADHYLFYPALRVKKGSFLCLPMLSESSGEPLGTVNLYRQETNGFSHQEITLFEKLCRQIARVLDKILLYHQTRALSVTDELTQISNRRYFNQRFEREIVRSQRYVRPLSVIMIDIDHFKAFNDTHGHLRGDEILRRVARILEQNLRKADLVARFGGEEFVVLLPEIDKLHARTVAEKLRQAIASHHFENAHTQPLGKITVSIGIASYLEDALQGEDLLEAADRMLYLAKSMGRNQVALIEEKDSMIKELLSDDRYTAAG
jgi:diguanylate cyclase (GGDEF)-like protein